MAIKNWMWVKLSIRQSLPILASEEKSTVVSTDDEYTDAQELPEKPSSPSQPAPTDPVTNHHLKSEVMSYVQSTTQTVLQQIQLLSSVIHKQNNIIQRFVDSMVSDQSGIGLA